VRVLGWKNLDVDGWSVGDEVVGVGRVLALPHQLRVERGIAGIAHLPDGGGLGRDEVLRVSGYPGDTSG